MKQKVKKDLMRRFVAYKKEEYYNEAYRVIGNCIKGWHLWSRQRIVRKERGKQV